MEAERKAQLSKELMKFAINGDVLGTDEFLTKNGTFLCNVKEEDHGNVPIHVASSKGNLALVQLLIDHGANIDLTDIFGNAALHYACDKGQKDVLALLIKVGADIELADNRGNTPLHHACTADNLNCVNQLLKAGATPDHEDHMLQRPADKCRNPSIKAIINNSIKARKDGGESQGKESVNWMGFGIGLGVGIGLAMAQQQQAELDHKLEIAKLRHKEENEF